MCAIFVAKNQARATCVISKSYVLSLYCDGLNAWLNLDFMPPGKREVRQVNRRGRAHIAVCYLQRQLADALVGCRQQRSPLRRSRIDLYRNASPREGFPAASDLEAFCDKLEQFS